MSLLGNERFFTLSSSKTGHSNSSSKFSRNLFSLAIADTSCHLRLHSSANLEHNFDLPTPGVPEN